MSYLDKSLGAGERIVARAHFHWLYTVKAILALLILGWILIGIFICISMLVRQATTEIAVTSHRFVAKTGLFTLRTNEISLHNIEGVQLQQSLLGQIFGYGHLRIEGTGVDAVIIPDIADPVRFRAAIETAKDAEVPAAPPTRA